MNRKLFWTILVLVSTTVFAVAGCSLKFGTIRYKDDQQNALNATKKFHDLFNNGLYESVYEMADDSAKKTKSKEALITVLARLRDEKGLILNTELIDAKVEPRALYREVHLTFQTKFEHGDSKENITWYVSNEKAAFFTFAFE